MHSRVSRTTEARGTSDDLGDGAEDAPALGDVGVLEAVGVVKWRDTSKRSNKTSKEYLRPRKCLLCLCINATPCMMDMPCAS